MITNILKQPVTLAVIFVLPLTACVTSRSGHPLARPAPLSASVQPKAGTKQGATTPLTQPPPATPQATPAVPTQADQLAFIHQHRAPGTPFTDEDRRLVAALPPSPAAGSVTEAALVLGLVETVLNPLNVEAPTFEETDLAKTAPASPAEDEPKSTSLLSIEQLCKDHNVSLADALVENPLLGSYGVAKQILTALRVGENSSEFTTEITAQLKQQAGLWGALGGEAPLSDTPQATAPGGPAPAPVADLPPSTADLAGGDQVLAEAQALADRGDVQSAIKKANSVPGSSPMHAMAQDKVREFSNLAVQELRRKAASAFQSAMPVTDARTRADYLRQAKSYLEEAIKNYPSASQLPTVRENLSVISRDLETIESGQKGG